MVTAEEIAAVPIFAALGEVERERCSPRRRGHQPRAGRVRGGRGQRACALRAPRRPHRGRQAHGTGSSASSGSAGRETFGEVPSRSGRSSQSAFELRKPHGCRCRRARLPRRGCRGPGRREGGRQAGAPDRGRPRAAGDRGRPAAPRVIAVGSRSTVRARELRRFLDRNQIAHVDLGRRPRRRRGVGRPAARAGRVAGDPSGRRRGSRGRRPPGGRASSA